MERFSERDDGPAYRQRRWATPWRLLELGETAHVAAAEDYDCPLLTGDARLAEVGGLRCDIRLAIPA